MIITPAGRPIKAGFVIFAVFCLLLSAVGTDSYAWADNLKRVIDGDTIVLDTGTRVRLLGIDAPERGEPYADKSTEDLSGMLRRGKISLDRCAELDKYGRVLAVVHAGELNVNLRLLQRGLARPMLIPPCGRSVSIMVIEAAAAALKERRGLYAADEFTVVDHTKTGAVSGRKAVVAGRVRSVFRSKKALYLNFGRDWRTDFTAVIFNSGLERFEALGLEPAEYKGRFVYVLGKVKEYNGPEIIVKWPEQLLPLPRRLRLEPQDLSNSPKTHVPGPR